jgi:GTP cyclohydrolase I
MAPRKAPDRDAAAAAITAFLRAIGRDPDIEPALAGTGARVADAFVDDLCAGYAVDARALLAHEVIDGGTDLVVVRGLAVATTCPHHLMPAIGTAAVAFAPRGRVVGIGAVGRAVDAFARRLTLQEEIGEAVVDAIADALAPAWVGCRLVLTHSCMTARGERRHGARVETLALRGEVDRALAQAALGVGRQGHGEGEGW